jgi:hypothetical protein
MQVFGEVLYVEHYSSQELACTAKLAREVKTDAAIRTFWTESSDCFFSWLPKLIAQLLTSLKTQSRLKILIATL